MKPSPAIVGALAAVAMLGAAAPAAAQRYAAGSPGLGDPFFPRAGNGGYDVRSYFIDLDYDHVDGRLRGNVVVEARATQNLRRFNLDFRGYRITELTVGRRPAGFLRRGQELVIRPRPKLPRGASFTVRVAYAGEPEPVVDPDGTSEGWVATDDGAFVVNEPQGSPGWHPVNDNPRDKAIYSFRITVAAGHAALANGRLVSHHTDDGRTTWRWRGSSPMAPYLATATNGPFETRFGGVAKGLAEYNAVDHDAREDGDPSPKLAWERLGRQRQIIRFFTRLYGPYPFDASGGVVDHAPEVGYHLESQTRSMYSSVPSEATVVHEVAHQWFGNSVTLSTWPDIWLNEGFATWSEWIWKERHGGPSAAETFDELYAIREDSPQGRDLWSPAPRALPGPEELFSRPVYDRGAMTLQALREKIGHRDFVRVLRRWYRQNRDGNVRTAGLIRLSERVSGRRLDRFFRVWLFEDGKPEDW